ncbi:cyclin-T2-like [Symsagittifera roscoffensis]|uniref:cyclin-T2-like n=1 Tax=Symsagittifera roscoffensis TaxID=84072 RepID=UPI00307B30B2
MSTNITTEKVSADQASKFNGFSKPTSIRPLTSSNQISRYDNPSRWIFNSERLAEFPSVNKSYADLSDRQYRQQAANMIQDMSKSLAIQPLAINTAIVYMHRFFVFHSFDQFDRFLVAACCVFLACKVEEQPRKLEHVVLMYCKWRKMPEKVAKGEEQRKLVQEFILHEQLLVETLGFDVRVEHPHSSVIKITEKIKASKDLAQTSYLLATNTLHLTTFCLQYTPVVIACVCINLACKWGHWLIPKSNEKKDWWQYFAPSGFTQQKLDELTDELVTIIDQSPAKMKEHLKRKCLPGKSSCAVSGNQKETQSQTPSGLKKLASPNLKLGLKTASNAAQSVGPEIGTPKAETANEVHASATQEVVNDMVDSSSEVKLCKTEPSGEAAGSTESKRKQLSLSQYKERITSQKKLSETANTSPCVKAETLDLPLDEKASKQVDTPKKKSCILDETMSPGTDAITNLLKASALKIESSKLSIETPVRDEKNSSSDSISPGAESIALLITGSKVQPISQETDGNLTITAEVNASLLEPAVKVEPDREPVLNVVNSSQEINNLLKCATSVVATSSTNSGIYSIINSESGKFSKKSKSHKDKDKKKKTKSSKHDKKDKPKSERKSLRDESNGGKSSEESQETYSNLKIKLRLSPKAEEIETPPPPPISTENALSLSSNSCVLEVLRPEVNSTTRPSLPVLNEPAVAPIKLPGSLGSLLESKRTEISSGEDEAAARKSSKKAKKAHREKSEKKNKKRDRGELEDEEENGEQYQSHKHHKKHKKKAKSRREDREDDETPDAAPSGSLKLKIKLNGAHLSSHLDQSTESLDDQRLRMPTDSHSVSNIDTQYKESICVESYQPAHKKFKSLLSDLPMPPPPPS